jgi:hypothetical protein
MRKHTHKTINSSLLKFMYITSGILNSVANTTSYWSTNYFLLPTFPFACPHMNEVDIQQKRYDKHDLELVTNAKTRITGKGPLKFNKEFIFVPSSHTTFVPFYPFHTLISFSLSLISIPHRFKLR